MRAILEARGLARALEAGATSSKNGHIKWVNPLTVLRINPAAQCVDPVLTQRKWQRTATKFGLTLNH